MLNNTFAFDSGCAVVLGSFDGLHLGHCRLIEETVAEKANGLFTLALTFSKPPNRAGMLVTMARKEYLLKSMGIDTVFELDFAAVRKMSPEEFFEDILIGSLNAKVIVCGRDYRFGAGAAGNSSLLRELCDAHGIRLKVCDTVLSPGGDKVSSSAIRSLVRAGRVDAAALLLGRNFCLDGEVISGKGLGHDLGFPTVNQRIQPGIVLPRDGVYAVRTVIDSTVYAGVTNVGRQPTVGGTSRTVETHIIGFDGDLYGWTVSVEFVKRLRAIKKFPTREALTCAIAKDAEASAALTDCAARKNL